MFSQAFELDAALRIWTCRHNIIWTYYVLATAQEQIIWKVWLHEKYETVQLSAESSNTSGAIPCFPLVRDVYLGNYCSTVEWSRLSVPGVLCSATSVWFRTSSPEDGGWNPPLRSTVCSEEKHLYLAALKQPVVFSLSWSIQASLVVARMWIESCFSAVLVSSRQTQEEGCTLSAWGVPFLDFCSEKGKSDLVQEWTLQMLIFLITEGLYKWFPNTPLSSLCYPMRPYRPCSPASLMLFFFWHSFMNSCTAIKYLNSCIWD